MFTCSETFNKNSWVACTYTAALGIWLYLQYVEMEPYCLFSAVLAVIVLPFIKHYNNNACLLLLEAVKRWRRAQEAGLDGGTPMWCITLLPLVPHYCIVFLHLAHWHHLALTVFLKATLSPRLTSIKLSYSLFVQFFSVYVVYEHVCKFSIQIVYKWVFKWSVRRLHHPVRLSETPIRWGSSAFIKVFMGLI